MTLELNYDLISGFTRTLVWGCNSGILSRLGAAIAPLHPLAMGLEATHFMALPWILYIFRIRCSKSH